MLRRSLMAITDIGMLLYWGTTSLAALSIISLPTDWLFKDYYDLRVVAWNWSFFPLDIALSLTGLWALRLERASNPSWKVWAVASLTLTICAGLMAISYWGIMGEFDITWWVPNLFLMIWPIPFLFQLARDSGQSAP